MHVWEHFAISLVVSYILVSSLSLSFPIGLTWIFYGVFFGTLIDLDHFPFVLLTKKYSTSIIKRDIFNLGKIDFDFEKGRLKFDPKIRLLLHAGSMLVVFVLSLNFLPSYSFIIGINLLVHFICDLGGTLYGEYKKQME